MLTPSDLTIFLSIGILVGALFGASACLYLPPTADDPHPGMRSAAVGAIGGGIIFAVAAAVVFQSLAALLVFVLLCLSVLVWWLRS